MKRSTHVVAAAALTWLIIAAPAWAHGGEGKKAAAKKVTSVEGITEYQLDNGLRVLLFPDKSKDTVTVNVTYLVGSRMEGYGETGMAHLLEHLVFKGTTKIKDLWKDLQEHGASFNGSTWTDRTNYFETMPADAKGENLKWALEMEADRMVNSRISAEDLKTEFSVVRNEFEAGENNPVGVLEERMMSTAFLWHNYGKSTIGSRSDIERVPIENLKDFYRRYYQPDNAYLIVAGKFDTDKTLELIQSTFGAIPRPKRKLPDTHTIEPVQDGERVVTLRRNGDVAVVGLMYHTVAGGDEDFIGTEALVDVLTDEPSGRLYKALVKTGMATRVWGSTYGWAQPGTIQLYAEVRLDKKLEPVRDKMIAIVEGLATSKEPISDAEVKRFRVRALKNWKLTFTSSSGVGVELSEWAAIGDWRMIFIYRDRMEKLDTARVQKVAAAYLKPDNRTLGMFVPTKTPSRAPAPADKIDVLALVKGYQGRDKISEGEAFEASVKAIEKRVVRGELKNGAKVAYLARETRGDAVRVQITLRFGTEKDFKGKTTAASLVGQMLKRGTATRNYQQILDEIDVLEARLNVGSGAPGTATINITTTRERLPAVLELAAEIARKPTFPADQLEIIRKEGLADLEQALSDPQAQGFTTWIRKVRVFDKNDVRYVPSTTESIALLKAVKLADLKALHKLWGASNATISVVGDFDPAEIGPVLEQHFGTWKSPKPYKRIDNPFAQTAAAEETIDTPDKEMALIVVGHNIELRDDDPDFAAMEIMNYILGGSPSSRLFTRLRQKEGISYGAFSFMNADSQDKSGILGAGAILAPQNAAKGMKAMMEEFELLISKGVPADELDKAKASWRKDFDRDLANDGYLLGVLNQGLDVGRTMEYQQQLADAVGKLTPGDLARVLKKYVQTGSLVKITAMDVKKATAPAEAQPADKTK